MSNTVRQELIRVLVELSEVCPEMRLGQLIANLSYLARGLSNESIWDVEDEELLVARPPRRRGVTGALSIEEAVHE